MDDVSVALNVLDMKLREVRLALSGISEALDDARIVLSAAQVTLRDLAAACRRPTTAV